MLKTILFDLDGTLLDINVKKFTKKYFCSLSEFAHIHNYQYTKLLKALLSGVRRMVNNDSEKTNEAVFWDNFANVYPVNVEEAKNNFINYYQDDFKKLKTAFSRKKYARKLVDELKRKGYKLVLTTNPTFPLIAIENRMSWTKLTKDDFEFITTYENSYHAKPNLDYYRDVLKRVNCKGEECLIIGNDIDEDMVAEQLGIKTFLITDTIINRKNTDISKYNRGSLKDALSYISSLEE